LSTDPFDEMTQEEMDKDDDKGNSLLQAIVSHGDGYKFTFLTKANCLIYMALSRQKNESVSFLKKQLEMMHLQLVSISTRQVMTMLIQNPSFDLMGEMWNGLPLLRRMTYGVNKNVATFLNMYQPLRMDKTTSEHVDFVIKENKP
jgi:hypothetical protein